ncbi:MAG: hypothetical protein WBW81_13455 [Methylocella sp.]
MKRIAAYVASAALGAVLAGSGPAWAQMRSDESSMGGGPRSVAKNQIDREHGRQWRHHREWRPGLAWHGYPYNPDNYAYNYGYPYNAQGYWYPSSYAYSYGYPYNYAYGYGYPYASSYPYDNANPFAIVTAPIAAVTAPVTALAAPVAQAATAPVAGAATAPLVTGRSVATGQMGRMCSTPAKACELYHESWVGNGCSCKVPGGHSRGTVSP